MSHNWYVGQDIVCIKSHSKGIVKNGEVYTIQALMKPCCSVQIDIGARGGLARSRCVCKNIIGEPDNVFWLGEHRFVPLDEITDISEI